MSDYPPIETLLPHAQPMLLVERIIEHCDDLTRCELVVRAGAAFVSEGAVCSIVALEYMAQTIGAHSGYRSYLAGRAPQLGFLIGCRELRLEQPSIAVGTRLVVSAQRVFGDEQLGQFSCHVRSAEGVLVAEGVLSVALDRERIS